jgi:hypothetical protein
MAEWWYQDMAESASSPSSSPLLTPLSASQREAQGILFLGPLQPIDQGLSHSLVTMGRPMQKWCELIFLVPPPPGD